MTAYGTALKRLDPTRGIITLRTNGGDSYYNSLQARLERGFKNGLLFRGAYTFSKAMDDVNSEVFLTTGGSSTGSNYFNKRVDRSRASFDVPHRFVFSAVYSLPTFFQNNFAKNVFGGFQISGVYSVQSGFVDSPYVGGIDINNDRAAINNPNAPANSVAIRGDLFGSDSAYVDANGDPINPANARYVVDPSIRTNVAGRNTLRGPRQNNFDASLTKTILFGGDRNYRFEIRADMFNVLNHPNFAPGPGDVTDPNFNDPYKFGDGTNRTGRIQLRLAF